MNEKKLRALAERIAAQDHVTGLGPQLEALINGWIDDAREALGVGPEELYED